MYWINKIKNKWSLLLGIILSQLFLINNTYAQFAKPDSSDLSVSFLSQIFGSLTGGGNDAFGASVAVFNGAILTIGGILAAYTILAGTLGTAHDGEMLGKKFSSVWIPIRYALGTALVLPVMKGGYCLMQAIVMWITIQGISLANMTWTEYVKIPPLVSSISAKSKGLITGLVIETYAANVCVEAFKKVIEATKLDGDRLELAKNHVFASSKNADGSYVFGNQKNGPETMAASDCGVVTVPVKPPPPKNNKAPTGNGVKGLDGISVMFTDVNTDPVRTAHVKATENVVAKTKELAIKAIADPESVKYSQLEAIAEDYVKTIQDATTATLSNSSTTTNMTEAASKQGWFMAGTWFTKIINTQNSINIAAADMATGQGKRKVPNTANIKIRVQVSTEMARGLTALARNDSDAKDLASNPSGQKRENPHEAENSSGFGSKIAKMLTKSMTGLNLEELKDDKRHPIVLMNAIGTKMMDFFLNTMYISVAAIGAVGFFSLGTAGSAATILSSFLLAPLAILFTTGISLAYILPNLPILIWMGIIIGWTIMVVEAIIAAPLWAIMHLHPNGDDLTGRGGNGYMLVLGLLLRPVLIIFGFIAAIILSGLFGELLNKIYFEVFSSSQMGGSMGFFSMIAGTAIYAVIMYTILTKTLSLMHVIPDQLMRWIGGGGEQLGQYAGSFSGEGMAKTGAAVGAVSGALGSQGFSNASGVLSNLNQIHQAKKGQEEQKAGNLQDKELAAQTKAEKKQGQENQENNSFNNKIGSADNIAGKISAEMGSGTQDTEKAKSQVSNANDALGGNGSEAAESYKAALADNMESGQSFSEAHSTALSGAANQKWGEGAGNAISQLSSEGQPMNTIFSQLNAKQNSIQQKTRDTGKTQEIMSGMFTQANNIKQDSASGPTSFKSALATASGEVNSKLNKTSDGSKDSNKGNDSKEIQ